MILTQEELLAEHKTIVETIIANKGGFLLNIYRQFEYNQNITFCLVKCKYNHEWTTTIDRLKHGYWCKHCGLSVDPEKVKEEIENKGGILLKDEIENGSRYLTIRCIIDGHEWKAKLSSIRNKDSWCRECYINSKIIKVDCAAAKEKINSKGFELLTPAPFDYWSEIEIRCPAHNHTWKTSFRHIDNGSSGCRFCSAGTISMDELNKILASKNYTFIERIAAGCSLRNIVLHCNIHNHTWKTNCKDIKRNDRICYYCALEARKTSYKKIKNAVEEKHGVLLTENCTGSLTKIQVRCENNHEFETYYDNINQGCWCPQCPWIKQTELFNILKKLFPCQIIEYNFKGFGWLKYNGSSHPMEIDIWLPGLKLAIEYDGEQHFMPIKFSSYQTKEGMGQALKDLQARDIAKTSLIAQHPDEVRQLIRFKYDEPITEENVIKKLTDAGVVLPHQ